MERRGGAQRGERGAVAAERDHEVARADLARRRDLLLRPGERTWSTSAPWRSAHSWTVARARPSSRRGCTTSPMRWNELAFTACEGTVGTRPARCTARAPRLHLRIAAALASRAMCFAYDASPPTCPPTCAPIAGGAGAELLELESADGTRFSAALAESPEPRGRAVVILPDVRGLYPFYIGARRALRRRRAPRDRDRLLRAHRRARSARRGLRVHAARQRDAAASGARPGRRGARRRRRCASAPGAEELASVGFCFGGTAVVPRRDERRARPRPA